MRISRVIPASRRAPQAARQQSAHTSHPSGLDEKGRRALVSRASTGIPGLDGLVEGGLERGSVNVILGGPGTGKTIMGVQFLYNGITKFNEPGVLINLEHDSERFQSHMLKLGMNVEKLQAERKLVVLTYSPNEIREIMKGGGGMIKDAIDQIGAKRMVLDPLSAMITFYEKKHDMRDALVNVFSTLRSWDMTTLGMVEFHSSGISVQDVHPTIQFLSDSVINLGIKYEGGSRKYSMEILKMRGTNHCKSIVPYDITDVGVVVNPGTAAAKPKKKR